MSIALIIIHFIITINAPPNVSSISTLSIKPLACKFIWIEDVFYRKCQSLRRLLLTTVNARLWIHRACQIHWTCLNVRDKQKMTTTDISNWKGSSCLRQKQLKFHTFEVKRLEIKMSMVKVLNQPWFNYVQLTEFSPCELSSFPSTFNSSLSLCVSLCA